MPAEPEAPVGMPTDAPMRAAMAELCRRYHVRRLDIFGSAVREDFDPARSGLDLVEGLKKFLDRKVDLSLSST
jgi:predicted nucleotidyltransferase